MNLPNKITTFRIVMIPVFILFMEVGQNLAILHLGESEVPLFRLFATIIFIVASLSDWLDGNIARSRGLVTNFGKFADPLADKMLVISALIELVRLDLTPAWVVVIIVARELAVTGLRLVLSQEGEVLAAAWPGKLKTTFQMLSIIFLLMDDYPFGNWPIGITLMYFALLLTLYSGFDYFFKNRKKLFAEM